MDYEYEEDMVTESICNRAGSHYSARAIPYEARDDMLSHLLIHLPDFMGGEAMYNNDAAG
ncbi:MAG: hypothetical protein LBD16_09055 [Oscillospiraceae bacterium]|jgi:hypothetical protein|nr:hypothetical protein [Oscillospiraceae bacterium]